MEYNSTRDHLRFREYGRNVQKMVQQTLELQDREKRNQAAKAIVSLMAIMNPQVREQQDYKHKLWDHLFEMAEYKLDVDCPYEIRRPEDRPKPVRMNYSDKRVIRFGHYGRIVQEMIKKVSQMPEGEDRSALVGMLANQLKKSYLTWNRDSVGDDVIENNLRLLSEGMLQFDETIKLSHTRDILRNNPPVNQNNKNRKNGQQDKYRNNNQRHKFGGDQGGQNRNRPENRTEPRTDNRPDKKAPNRGAFQKHQGKNKNNQNNNPGNNSAVKGN